MIQARHQRVRIAAWQLPESPGKLPVNRTAIVNGSRLAAAKGAQLVCFPECFLQGYVVDPKDSATLAVSLDSDVFLGTVAALSELPLTVVFGLIEAANGCLYNSAVVVRGGHLLGVYRKSHLLAREALVFEPGAGSLVVTVDDLRFGINICKDLNYSEAAAAVRDAGAELLVCPCNNLLKREAAEQWQLQHNAIRGERCRETGLWLLSSDVTGERDGRVGLGPTSVLDPAGRAVAQVGLRSPGLLLYDLPHD